jgi:antitoxin VapB
MIYIFDIYHPSYRPITNSSTDSATAKIFKHGRSQAVRLPKEFRLPGTEVRVRRIGRAVLLEPFERDRATMEAVFAEIDRLGGAEFLPEGRPVQPPMPIDDRKYFDDE